MNTRGHFRLNREIFGLSIFKNPVDFRLFILILGHGMFKDGVKAGAEILNKGEWLRSYRQLQKDLEYIDGRATRQYGIGTIKRSADRLTAEHLIETRIADSGTVFRVLNFEEWQGIADLQKAKAERIAEHHPGTKRSNELVINNESKEEKILPTNQPSAREKRLNFFDTFFMAYGKQPTPLQLGQLTSYIDDEGLEEELLLLAIDKAAKVSGHFEYLKGILNNWTLKGIKTKSEAEKENHKRRERREQTSAAIIPKGSRYQDIGADW
jgi:DnaD/phage-associated family protein